MTLRSVFEIRPAPGRFPVAIQAGLAIGIPAIGGALLGRPEIGLLASTGGFTALHLVDRSRRRRAAVLPFVAAGLVLSSALGVAASGFLWLAVITVGVVAIVAATVMFGFRAGPPSALMFTLTAGSSTHVAASAAAGGGGQDGAVMIALVALGSVIAYLVVIAPLAVPAVRRRDRALHAAEAPVRFVLDATARVVLGRLAVGLVVAVVVGGMLGEHRGYWVIVTAVAILQNGHRVSIGAVRAVHRVAGTIVGVAVFVLIAALHATGLPLALLVTALQIGVELLVVRNYGLALVLITPLALSLSTVGGSDPLLVARDRALDTALGGAIALAVLLVARLARRGADPAA